MKTEFLTEAVTRTLWLPLSGRPALKACEMSNISGMCEALGINHVMPFHYRRPSGTKRERVDKRVTPPHSVLPDFKTRAGPRNECRSSEVLRA